MAGAHIGAIGETGRVGRIVTGNLFTIDHKLGKTTDKSARVRRDFRSFLIRFPAAGDFVIAFDPLRMREGGAFSAEGHPAVFVEKPFTGQLIVSSRLCIGPAFATTDGISVKMDDTVVPAVEIAVYRDEGVCFLGPFLDRSEFSSWFCRIDEMGS